MIVECFANRGEALPETCRNEMTGMTVDAEFPLTVGKRYVVYAFTIFDGYSWFYVFDEDKRPYPIWYPAALFKVTDPQIPDDWVFGYVRPRPNEDGFPIVSFPEWALDRRFYEELVDGSPSAKEIFARRRISAESSS
jgi:hypothetical protein